MYPEEYILYRLASYNSSLFKELREFHLKQEKLVLLLKNEIIEFEFNHNLPFRPDAKYFIISNFNNMIIKPIMLQSNNNDQEINDDQLKKYLISDVRTIMFNALENRKEDKISGHDILKSIDSLWLQLQSTKMEVWG